MTIKPGVRDLLWMASGAAAFLVITLIVMRFHHEPDPAAQIAAKAARIELVDRMRVSLASAAESEKSAVLATNDQDSQAFADQARAASADVEQGRQELDQLIQASGAGGERDLLGQFSEAFADFRRVDGDLLGLAVKNTNLKAYALDYGPAMDALNDTTAALSRLATLKSDTPQGPTVMRLAYGAEITALRVQTLLPPHIAEESDATMDQMETHIAEQDQEVQAFLDGLRALPAMANNAELQSATASWTKFRKLKTQILALSRENTNVKSLALSLDRKRKVMLACQEALAALRQAIEAEPVAGVTYGPPPRPR